MIVIPIIENRRWKVKRTPNEIADIANFFLVSKGANIEEITAKRVKANMGSMLKTRFYGGLFVSEKTLPISVTLYLFRDEFAGETVVDGTIVDTLGPGLRAGIVGKYQGYMQKLFNELFNSLQA